MFLKRALNDFCGFFAFCSKQQKHFVWGDYILYNGGKVERTIRNGTPWNGCHLFVEDV